MYSTVVGSNYEVVRLISSRLISTCLDLFSLTKYYLFYQLYTIYIVRQTECTFSSSTEGPGGTCLFRLKEYKAGECAFGKWRSKRHILRVRSIPLLLGSRTLDIRFQQCWTRVLLIPNSNNIQLELCPTVKNWVLVA